MTQQEIDSMTPEELELARLKGECVVTTKELWAVYWTFRYFHPHTNTHNLCPKCGQRVMMEGYRCTQCGYDKYDEE